MVEHLICNQRVGGSNPSASSNIYYGFEEQLKKTIEFLQAGNYLNVDLFAIKKASGGKMIAPLGSVPFTLAANDVRCTTAASHSVAYDNTVQAGRSSLVRYEFRIPASAKSPLTVTARVNYRRLRQIYLNNVLGKNHPADPVVEIASRSRALNLGENAVTGGRNRISGSVPVRRRRPGF